MIKEKYGPELDKWIQSAMPFLFRRPINPNLLTVVGSLICVGSAFAFGQGALALGSFLLGIGGLFDLLDGVVARHFGSSSAFGAFLDSTLDRLVVPLRADQLYGVQCHLSGRRGGDGVLRRQYGGWGRRRGV